MFDLRQTKSDEIIVRNERQYSGVTVLINNNYRADALEYHYEDQISVFQVYPRDRKIGKVLHIIGVYNTKNRNKVQMIKEIDLIVDKIK